MVCRCKCGVVKEYSVSAVCAGRAKSCGCYRSFVGKKARKHGKAGTPEYGVWQSVKNRCNNPNNKNYNRYGGRGIRVCKRWDSSFLNFLEDMGERPSSEHTIDRINNDKGYSPSNCRWATRSEQGANTSTNRNITYKGVTKNLSQWAKTKGINLMTLHQRLARGWSVDKALSTKPLVGFSPFREDPYNPAHFKNPR